MWHQHLTPIPPKKTGDVISARNFARFILFHATHVGLELNMTGPDSSGRNSHNHKNVKLQD